MVLLAALSCPQECGPGSLLLPSWRIRAPHEFNAFQRFLLGKWSLGPVSSFPLRALSSGTTMGMIVCQGSGCFQVGVFCGQTSGWVHVAEVSGRETGCESVHGHKGQGLCVRM